jgi:hypothetical protein
MPMGIIDPLVDRTAVLTEFKVLKTGKILVRAEIFLDMI